MAETTTTTTTNGGSEEQPPLKRNNNHQRHATVSQYHEQRASTNSIATPNRAPPRDESRTPRATVRRGTTTSTLQGVKCELGGEVVALLGQKK